MGDAGKTRVASKNRVVSPKTFRPQFSKFSLVLESAVFHIYQNTADSRTRLNFENCGRKVLGNTVLGFFFWLEIRVNFERPYLDLRDSLPPFAIHILNRLDMRIHQVVPKIYHTPNNWDDLEKHLEPSFIDI